MSADLIVDDEYIHAQAKAICNALNDMDDAIEKYVEYTTQLKSLVIKQGKTADALNNYIQHVSTLKGHLRYLSEVAGNLSGEYLGDIDAADKDLF